jgi:hypothetical protein
LAVYRCEDSNEDFSSIILEKITMSKERKSNKENKKKPALSSKEKKAAKRNKKDARSSSKGLLN